MAGTTRRRRIAPVLTATAVAGEPHAAADGVHVTTILNIALLEPEPPDDTPAAPASGVRAAAGPLIVEGIVLPGLRFGS